MPLKFGRPAMSPGRDAGAPALCVTDAEMAAPTTAAAAATAIIEAFIRIRMYLGSFNGGP
jgi:hypothetical protein